MSSTVVYLLGNDISQYVSEVPGITLQAAEFGQVLINPITSIVGSNVYRFWDAQYPASPFYGATAYDGYTMQIVRDGVTIFDGSVLNIALDESSRTANVQLRSEFQRICESGAVYVSGEGVSEDPATAVRNILTQYGLPFDPGSFGQASAVYTANSVVINVQSPLGDVTVTDLLQQICDIGVARLSLSQGVLRFEVWQENLDSDPLYTFTDVVPNDDGCTLLSPAPGSETIQKDGLNGYTVEWVGSVEDFGSEFANKKTISGPADATVRILTAQSAVWIGRQWMTYMQRPQRRISIRVPVAIAKQLDVGFPIAVNYSRWTTAVTVDIVSINAGAMVVAEIVGTTR